MVCSLILCRQNSIGHLVKKIQTSVGESNERSAIIFRTLMGTDTPHVPN